MKKWFAFGICFLLGANVFAAQGFQEGQFGLEGMMFLDPHVKNLSEKVSAISLNIGSKLSSTTHQISTEICKEIGLGAHFKNLSKGLEVESRVVVTAPASYGVVFTTANATEEEALKQIDQVLSQLGATCDFDRLNAALAQLTKVARATFVMRENGIMLVTDEKQLQLGETVYLKTLNGVDEQIYHSEEEYLVNLANAGFFVEEIKRPRFYDEVRYKMYFSSLQEGERGLGRAYIENHPFTIYYAVKKG